MTRKLLIALTMVFAMSSAGYSQGWLKKLKDKAVEKVKEKVEQKVENEVDEAADDLLNGKKSKSTKKERSEETTAEGRAAAASAARPSTATSSDFKRGSIILFEDDLKSELVGEVPGKWDLISGKMETKTIGGEKAIEFTEEACITPLIKEPGGYLPEEFTVEYDFYYWDRRDDVGGNEMRIIFGSDTERKEMPHYANEDCPFMMQLVACDGSDHIYYRNGKDNRFDYQMTQGWHHVAVSFNKRALKVYIDGNRVVNLPNVTQPQWLCFFAGADYKDLYFIRNIVIAKGAVALYDRNAQSMTAVEKAIAETGKFVTNNILFDTGKATLKPESLGEIQKVADYMKKNTRARFEVQGHTDNQGSDKINDPLSQQRAEAIVKALVSMGCDEFNLRAVGKGSHEPVADNKTEAGRAKNRRVEFIKK